MSNPKSEREWLQPLNVTLRRDQVDRLQALATAQDRSVSYTLREILDQCMPTEETR